MTSLQIRFLSVTGLIAVGFLWILTIFLFLIKAELDYPLLFSLLFVALISSFLHYLAGKKGKTKFLLNFSSITFNLINIFSVSIAIYSTGGIRSPFLWIFYLMVIVNLLMMGYGWAIITAVGSMVMIIIVELLLHQTYFLEKSDLLELTLYLAPLFIFLSSVIVIVKYAETTRLFHDFGLGVELKKNLHIRKLLVSMVAPTTIEESLADVRKNLNKILHFDFLAFATVQNNKLHFTHHDGLPKSVLGYEANTSSIPKKEILLKGFPCSCDIQSINGCDKLKDYDVRSTIISPILQNKKISAIFLIGTRGRNVEFTSNDLELVHTITEQLSHIWKLQTTVSQLQVEEKKLKAALKEKKKLQILKSEFISIASHQLRTPLSSMRWFLEMLQGGDFGKLNTEQIGAVEQISEANQRMITLINDMMEVSKVEDGKIKARIVPTPIVSVIEQVIADQRIISNAKNVTLLFEKPKKTLPPALADPVLVNQVLQNLVSNSVKYTNARGRVSISAEVVNNAMRVLVKDTGIGIKKSDFDKIFTKFYRAEEVKKLATDGSGLGLYLSKAMIEVMDGKIGFDSRYGKGSTFYITIPLAKNL